MKTNASQNNKCNGCKHQNYADGEDWCYMFEKQPNKLPCAQHDKYKYQREATAKLIKSNPLFLLANITNINGD